MTASLLLPLVMPSALAQIRTVGRATSTQTIPQRVIAFQPQPQAHCRQPAGCLRQPKQPPGFPISTGCCSWMEPPRR